MGIRKPTGGVSPCYLPRPKSGRNISAGRLFAHFLSSTKLLAGAYPDGGPSQALDPPGRLKVSCPTALLLIENLTN